MPTNDVDNDYSNDDDDGDDKMKMMIIALTHISSQDLQIWNGSRHA